MIMKRAVTYKTSGVDIDKANVFVDGIQSLVKNTLVSGAIRRKGSFGGLFQVPKGYKNPVMVSSTDGVGTKLLIAKELNWHETVGIDLVAMNVNDILCVGAKPLFFLDYIACGKLNVRVLTDVVKGVTEGCRQSGCTLIGGETAEMPGMYKDDEYDLAGFAVGVVEKNRIVDGSRIKAGDVVFGLPSSGCHSNGYSLVRKALSFSQRKKFAKQIMAPTKIYAKEVAAVLSRFAVRGMAHITGGAYYEKLTKILPSGLCFLLDRSAWPVPEIFSIIQKAGRIVDKEMYRTFNMGIGYVFVVGRNDAAVFAKFLRSRKISAYRIGEVIRHDKSKVLL